MAIDVDRSYNIRFMAKSTRYLKKLMAIFLVVLMSIESFGAIVSDNDGSAFITKAEFDSLKNNFQSQIDQYNTSIDAKIDGAIAAYLAGVRVTVKQSFDTPVSNYQDIKWKRKLDVYGNYINWRNATTYNRYTNLWYEPHFDKRCTFRDPINQIHLYYQRFQGQFGVRLSGDLDISGCSYPVARSDWGVTANAAPAVSYLDCEYEQEPPMVKTGTDTVFKVHRGFNSRTGATPWDAHEAERWNGTGWLNFPNFEIVSCTLAQEGGTVPWFTSLPLEEDQVLNGYLAFHFSNSRSNIARLKVNQTKYTLQTFGLGMVANMHDSACGNIINQSNILLSDQSSTLFTDANVGGIYSDYISTNGARQNADVAEMMLGSDYDLEVNLARVSNGTKFVGTGYDRLLTYSDLGSIGWNINAVDLSQYLLWTADTNTRSMTYTTPVSTNLAIPFFERYRFDKMQSPYYKNGGEHLLYGQGLPLSTYLYNKGKVTITFDYDIGISVGSVPSEATGIKLDLKKTDFLSGNDDYYSGKRGDDKATEKFKDAIYDDTTNKVKIILDDVPVGSAIWLRIAPKSTSGGLYAKMRNLQMSVEN